MEDHYNSILLIVGSLASVAAVVATLLATWRRRALQRELFEVVVDRERLAADLEKLKSQSKVPDRAISREGGGTDDPNSLFRRSLLELSYAYAEATNLRLLYQMLGIYSATGLVKKYPGAPSVEELLAQLDSASEELNHAEDRYVALARAPDAKLASLAAQPDPRFSGEADQLRLEQLDKIRRSMSSFLDVYIAELRAGASGGGGDKTHSAHG